MQSQKNYSTKELAQKIIEHATAAGIKIATAESCTGGKIAAALTDISGSSKCYLGGLVTYDPSLKSKFLDLDQDLIDDDNLVSMECAKAMCEGLKNLLPSDIAFTTTGIAGPTTDSHNTKVGTVFYGVRFQNKGKVFSIVVGSGDEYELAEGENPSREQVREYATYHGLEILLSILEDYYKL
ncbi:MAG: nicotinamide-nucleotide amidohydrolase family protein [Coriobacteriales bacterium]|nr:nicotinamide-nucleotide amidohydrolase family protein [Coriobacteriales bacterium]